MKTLPASLVFAVVLGFAAAPVWAATRTVTLSVPGMDCAACPITIKKALSKVDGVSQTVISYDTREAIVTFDDTRTNVHKLAAATKNAGYPSSVRK